MKVPTYQAQTARTVKTGGTAFGVQASGAALASSFEQAARIYGTISDLAYEYHEQERKQQIAFQQQEAETMVMKRTAEILQDSSMQDAYQQDSYFEEKMGQLKQEVLATFDNDDVRKSFGLTFDQHFEQNRIDVRATARKAKMDKHLAVSNEAKKEHLRLMVEGNDLQKDASRKALDKLLAYERENGYISAEDEANFRTSASVKIKMDSAISAIAKAGSTEELDTILANLENREGEFSSFTDKQILELQSLTRSEISAIVSQGSRAETALAKVSKKTKDAILLKIELMSPEDALALLETYNSGARPDDLTDADYRALVVAARSRANDLNANLSALREGLTDSLSAWDSANSKGQVLGDDNVALLADRVRRFGTDDQQRQFAALQTSQEIIKSSQGAGLAQLESTLNQLEQTNTSGYNEFQLDAHSKMIEQVKKNTTGLRDALEKGQVLSWYRNNGGEQVDRIDPSNPASIEDRKALIAKLKKKNPGYEINFLMPEEVSSYVARFDDPTNVQERVRVADELRNMPVSVFNQVAKDGRAPLLAFASTQSPEVAFSIFNGQAKMSQKVQSAPTGNEVDALFADHVQGVFENVVDQAALKQAALAMYVDARKDFEDFDPDELAEILQILAPVAVFNGGKYELPPGVDSESFENYMDELTVEDVSKMLDVYRLTNYTEEQLLKDIESGNLLLKSYGQNRYALVNIQGQPVTAFETEGEVPDSRIFTLTYDPDIKQAQRDRSEQRTESVRPTQLLQDIDPEAVEAMGAARMRRAERIAKREAELKARREALLNSEQFSP